MQRTNSNNATKSSRNFMAIVLWQNMLYSIDPRAQSYKDLLS